MSVLRPIAISLSPNTQGEDYLQALFTLLKFWQWKKGDKICKVTDWFKTYTGQNNIFTFNSGRSSFYALLKSFAIGQGDEVLIQAFTCVAVPDPVLWSGAKPIFVDIDCSLNIDPSKIEKHISSRTKAIVVQHTFGIPAQIKLIKKIAQKYNLILIEDCSHSLGATIDGKKVGSLSDASFFSFGRDKVISSVFGGLAVINNSQHQATVNMKEFYEDLEYPSSFWILQQVLHPLFFSIILPFYNLLLGKILLWGLLKLRLLSKPVYKEELVGKKPKNFPQLFPNALAQLLLLQLSKLEKYNNFRKNIADLYFRHLSQNDKFKLPEKKDGAIYLRFNILTKDAEKIIRLFKSYKILLGDWYSHVIDPKEVDIKKVRYRLGTCKMAEYYANLSVNLPTYPGLTKNDLLKVITMLNSIWK